MKVDFFRANEQNAPTTEFYLFSDDYALVMNGQQIEHDGKKYQVTGLIWADDKHELLNVFLFEFLQHQDYSIN